MTTNGITRLTRPATLPSEIGSDTDTTYSLGWVRQ